MLINQTTLSVIDKILNSNKIPMLVGEPGIGKSSLVENLAQTRNTVVFTLFCNQLADTSDLTGLRLLPYNKVLNDGSTVQSYQQVFYPHKVITDAIDYAEANPSQFPILFLDELNRTTPDVTSALLSIPTARTCGSFTLPNNLKVIIAGNNKGNVTSLDSASISRFVCIPVEADAKTLMKLPNIKLHETIQTVLTNHPKLVYCTEQIGDSDDVIDAMLFEESEMTQFTTPRTIVALSDFLFECTVEELKSYAFEMIPTADKDISILEQIIYGHVGKTQFAVSVLAQIADFVQTKSSNITQETITKPQAYDNLVACTNIEQLDAIVANLPVVDLSSCFIFALCEQKNNEYIIIAILKKLNQLTHDESTKLVKHVVNNKVYLPNVEVVTNNPALKGHSIEILLSNFIQK